jgi:hypothetical protein
MDTFQFHCKVHKSDLNYSNLVMNSLSFLPGEGGDVSLQDYHAVFVDVCVSVSSPSSTVGPKD